MIGLLGNTDYIYTEVPLGTMKPNAMIPYTLSDTNTSSYSVFESPNKININCNGSIYLNSKIQATINNQNGSNPGTLYTYLKLFKNNVEIFSTFYQNTINKNSTSNFNFDLNNISVVIKKGDILSFKIYLGGYTSSQDNSSSLYLNQIKFNNGTIKAIPSIIGKDLIL
jgi:hypothetical protein